MGAKLKIAREQRKRRGRDQLYPGIRDKDGGEGFKWTLSDNTKTTQEAGQDRDQLYPGIRSVPPP